MTSVLPCAVQMVNEERDSNDARELLLSSVLQADTLTHIINKRITAEHVQQQPPEDTAPSKCWVEFTVEPNFGYSMQCLQYLVLRYASQHIVCWSHARK